MLIKRVTFCLLAVEKVTELAQNLAQEQELGMKLPRILRTLTYCLNVSVYFIADL